MLVLTKLSTWASVKVLPGLVLVIVSVASSEPLPTPRYWNSPPWEKNALNKNGQKRSRTGRSIPSVD